MKNSDREAIDSMAEHLAMDAIKSVVSLSNGGLDMMQAETEAFDVALEKFYDRMDRKFPFDGVGK